jgi:hypothetical protein
VPPPVAGTTRLVAIAYFPTTKLGLSNHQSVGLSAPLITFEPLGRFS